MHQYNTRLRRILTIMENLLLMPLAKSLVSSHISGTLVPLAFSNIPRDRLKDIVYFYPVVKQKYNSDGSVKFRVRGTAGDHLLHVPYRVHCQLRYRETSTFHVCERDGEKEGGS
jgi:hypothetical protein